MRTWVIIPAAGIGRRMASETPKQYLSLVGRTVLEWSIAPFLARADIAGIIIVHAVDDVRCRALPVVEQSRVRTTTGGQERAQSVLCGLDALSAEEHDWVLVHDAARPCLHADDLSLLIGEVENDAIGGLLAVPVSDTLKASDAQRRVERTVSRERLWRALTPQMFRYGVLSKALRESPADLSITDESSAVETLGLRPKLVVGRGDNIKITVPEDLAYAEHILRSRGAL